LRAAQLEVLLLRRFSSTYRRLPEVPAFGDLGCGEVGRAVLFFIAFFTSLRILVLLLSPSKVSACATEYIKNDIAISNKDACRTDMALPR
jgi:hypothetical protein